MILHISRHTHTHKTNCFIISSLFFSFLFFVSNREEVDTIEIMGLRDIGATLPPGFRFYPSDEELVCHYLFKKIANDHQVLKGTLVDIDLHTCEPWQLPEVAKLNASEWYFFSFRDRKYATGYRTNRATTTGYWKATGKDRTVHDPATKEIIGMRKTLVFYMNRAPNGIKTGWIMHEFRLESPNIPPKEDWVLCRVFHKSKGSEDNNTSPNKTSPQMMDHGTNVVVPTPPGHHETHDHNNVMPSGYHQSQNSLLSLLHFANDQTLTESTKPHHEDGDDIDYGFVWDLGLDKGSLLWEEEMKPYDHNQVDTDSNMVFI